MTHDQATAQLQRAQEESARIEAELLRLRTMDGVRGRIRHLQRENDRALREAQDAIAALRRGRSGS